KSIGDFIERVERYGSNIQSSGCFVSKVHAYADAGDPSFAQKPGFMEVSRGYGKDGIMYQFDPNGGNGETLCVIVRPSKLAKAASVFEGLKL
ncbi:MAG TPA: hypothetical protein VJB12_03275, partial [Candidatus Nanoarchaeia archaeon]|nr:hypothetical protein [Candidatus Nanoarchaeia archaeon]